MTRFYVKFIMCLIITRWSATEADCPPQDRNKLKENEPSNNEANNGSNNGVNNGITVKSKRPRSRCCPYNFDPTQCKAVGDRLLCGYNRNIGGYPSDAPVELQNGCRIRNNRLECGYVVGPFTNPRRPPAGDVIYPQYEETKPEKMFQQQDADKVSEEMPDEKFGLKELHPVKATTRCLEVKERIVCRY